MNVTYPENFLLFCAPDDHPSLEDAKEYILEKGLTNEDVRLRRDGEFVMVITKREVTLK